jgi:hypothetical protein
MARANALPGIFANRKFLGLFTKTEQDKGDVADGGSIAV